MGTFENPLASPIQPDSATQEQSDAFDKNSTAILQVASERLFNKRLDQLSNEEREQVAAEVIIMNAQQEAERDMAERD